MNGDVNVPTRSERSFSSRDRRYECIIRFFVDGKHINTRETAARIVLVDDIFRVMTLQVQYMAIHCTLK